MRRTPGRVGALLVLLSLCTAGAQARRPYLRAPAVNEYSRHDPEGTTILPSGRFLTPVGRHTPVAQWPHGLVASPDGSVLFVASEGVGQVVTGWVSGTPALRELAPDKTNAGGAAFSPDGKWLYWSSGETGAVYVFDLASGRKTATITLNEEVGGRRYEDSFVMDVKLSPNGRYLYCADVTNFRLGVVDTREQRLVGSVDVGRYPYALALAGGRVYVANIGMFEYKAIPKPSGSGYDERGLTRPAFGFPSPQARDGVQFEGRYVPGLGDPNVPESFSVWGVDVTDPAAPRVVSRLKTGLLVHAPADQGKTVGGSAPNYLAAQGRLLYVSDGNNDLVERIDLERNRIARRIALRPSPLTRKLRGVGPAGMVLSPDASRLYVAESGINAIAVIDTHDDRVLGHIPTAWYPYRLALSPDGRRLACICFKGFGNGPNAGKEIPKSPFLGMKGVLTVLDVPPDSELPALSERVLANNGLVDRSEEREALSSPVIPTEPGRVSDQIKHVVFITKENHTFDTIFDRVPGANHDPTLLRWGYHQRIESQGQPTLEDVAVMTNHNALARQFTVSDNFHMEPEFSGVGHRWLIGVQPNNFCQMTYTLGWDFKASSSAPGRLVSFGSNGSIQPEDYPEAGAMWEHLARSGVPFRNYGEGFELAGVIEGENTGKTGAREVVNLPMSQVVYDNTCWEFPIFNMNIPDQYRADWFIQDFTDRYLGGRGTMPPFINIAICNDHGSSPRPDRGYPYVASWMADNDLAMGRIVEFLSHTPYWRNMAIFVTEDDSGGEPDHVDAQRSVLLVISPWARRGYVSHRHTTILSMHRTLYQILGLGPLNLFDATANDLADAFTTTPDYRPYQCVPVDPRVFDPQKARDPHDPDFQRARRMPTIPIDAPQVMDSVLRQAGQELGVPGPR